MEGMDEGLVLSLKLALEPDYGCDRKRRRMRVETGNVLGLSEIFDGGKILALLQTRKQMLNLNYKGKEVPDQVDRHGIYLIHLLLIVATSVNANDIGSAVENLSELYQSVCLTGDSVQRVAAYFADGLVARLLSQTSPFYDMITKAPTPDEELLAFTELYKVSPLYQFAHFTANQAILEAFEKVEQTNNRALHVIDFDISYGFQWPSLMQSLSEKATTADRIWLKITGYGRSMEELKETESKLVSFARSFCNLVFEFHGLIRGSKLVQPKKKENETLAVNLIFHRNSLNSSSQLSDTLRFVYCLNPSIVVLVEQEGSRNGHKFLLRFVESLHYFAAIFDSLDDCLPPDSAKRLNIEKNYLGKEIKHLISCNADGDKHPRLWKGSMESHGFQGLKQSSKAIMQAKLLLKIRSHGCATKFGGFRVCERDDGKVLALGWQERFLTTASSWCCSK